MLHGSNMLIQLPMSSTHNHTGTTKFFCLIYGQAEAIKRHFKHVLCNLSKQVNILISQFIFCENNDYAKIVSSIMSSMRTITLKIMPSLKCAKAVIHTFSTMQLCLVEQWSDVYKMTWSEFKVRFETLTFDQQP